jgi:hypothetical protein
MENPMIMEAFRGHNKSEQYVEMEVYADHRAMDFTSAYLRKQIEEGHLQIKDFEFTGCYVSTKPAARKGNRVYEVHYQEKQK